MYYTIKDNVLSSYDGLYAEAVLVTANGVRRTRLLMHTIFNETMDAVITNHDTLEDGIQALLNVLDCNIHTRDRSLVIHNDFWLYNSPKAHAMQGKYRKLLRRDSCSEYGEE